MNFEFATAARVVFGPGTVREAATAARGLGSRALLVTGRGRERAEPFRALLKAQGISTEVFPVAAEPTTHLISGGVAAARSANCDFVIGFGGGSALDAAKAIAALLTNEGELLDYLEVVGRAQPLTRPSAPCLAIPTTAGTGAEVTRNAVLASPEHRVKVSLRSPLMLPRLAVVDPDLTLGLPAGLTASTGLDALTQLIEPFVSCRANPMIDGLCREGTRRVARALRRAWAQPDDAAAREDMALASLFGGFALANAGLGAVHGFAGPIGGMFDAPHGAVCAALLPATMEMNLRALRQRAVQHPALGRYEEIAAQLTGRAQATAEEGIEWVSELCAALKVQRLSAFGVKAQHLPEIVEKAAVSSSMKGNPLPLTRNEMTEILEAAV